MSVKTYETVWQGLHIEDMIYVRWKSQTNQMSFSVPLLVKLKIHFLNFLNKKNVMTKTWT